MKFRRSLFAALALPTALVSQPASAHTIAAEEPAPVSTQTPSQTLTQIANAAPIELAPNERLITILGTNDIHGGVEARKARDGVAMTGGMAQWKGISASIRQGLAQKYGQDRAGTVIVDAGDQFQGTLVSNFNEGLLVFKAMNEVGYDAVITGNHDYDFGPIGWLEDQVTPKSPDQNPRGALLRAIGSVEFPVISANTFVRDTFFDHAGKKLSIKSAGCRPPGAVADADAKIDWSRVERPSFLKSHVIKTIAGGVRVALIGLDNTNTEETTTKANVEDLCFGDLADSYLRVRRSLEGQADVFVIVMHEGNAGSDFGASKFVRKLPEGSVHAVISGHTHFVTNTRDNGVAMVQSGFGGDKFGRIDLVYNVDSHQVSQSRTRAYAGVEMHHARCAPSSAAAPGFCTVADGVVSYEGVPVVPSAKITAEIAAARAEVAPIASRRLGVATGEIKKDRASESPLANALTDALRGITRTEIAFMNAGGIRTAIPAGEITYESLFEVLPFNNHGLVIGPMPAEKVIGLLAKSVQTCGAFGTLQQSGLRVTFERDCASAGGQTDAKARLLTVQTLEGEMVFDAARGGLIAPAGRTFVVATLDFLLAGGSGFDGFKGAAVIRDAGIVRDLIADYYVANPATLTPAVDGRWAESVPTAASDE